jgi:hypothetical protein
MVRLRRDNTAALGPPIHVRLSIQDREAFIAKAEAAGLTQSDFFRQCVMTNRTHVVARAPASTDRKRVLFFVSKASNNLNQLAHAVNSERLTGRVSEGTILSVLDSLLSLELLLKAHLTNVD